jgi:diacylglycerol kinase family enzyme
LSISVIINPIAGGFAGPVGARVDLARRVASECGETADVLVSESGGHARALALAARANGARVVIAWGGDGTINEVSRSFGEVALVPLPDPATAWRVSSDSPRTQARPAGAITGTPKSIDTGG